VTLYRVSDATVLREIAIEATPATIRFSPDGRCLAICDTDRGLWLCDTTTGRVLNKLRGHTTQIMDLTWARDGRSLFSLSLGGEVFQWKNFDRLARPTLQAAALEKNRFGQASVSPDGRLIAVMRDDHVMDVVSTDYFEVQASFADVGSFLGFNRDSRELSFLRWNAGIQHWSLQRWSIEARPRLMAESEASIDAHATVYLPANGDWLAMTDRRGHFSVWDRSASHMIFDRQAHTAMIIHLKFSFRWAIHCDCFMGGQPRPDLE